MYTTNAWFLTTLKWVCGLTAITTFILGVVYPEVVQGSFEAFLGITIVGTVIFYFLQKINEAILIRLTWKPNNIALSKKNTFRGKRMKKALFLGYRFKQKHEHLLLSEPPSTQWLKESYDVILSKLSSVNFEIDAEVTFSKHKSTIKKFLVDKTNQQFAIISGTTCYIYKYNDFLRYNLTYNTVTEFQMRGKISHLEYIKMYTLHLCVQDGKQNIVHNLVFPKLENEFFSNAPWDIMRELDKIISCTNGNSCNNCGCSCGRN